MLIRCIVLILAVAVGQIAAAECTWKHHRSPYQITSRSKEYRGDSASKYSGCSDATLGRAPPRHVYSKRKYPVILKPSLAAIERQIPVTRTHITTPVQEKPIIHLPADIPKPRTISHTCTCYHTILVPGIRDKIITVPTVQRYVDRAHAPDNEKLHFPCQKLQQQQQQQQQIGNSEIVFGSLDPSAATAAAAAAAAAVAEIQLSRICSPEFSAVQYPENEAPVPLIEIPQVQSFQVPRGRSYQSPCYSAC